MTYQYMVCSVIGEMTVFFNITKMRIMTFITIAYNRGQTEGPVYTFDKEIRRQYPRGTQVRTQYV